MSKRPSASSLSLLFTFGCLILSATPGWAAGQCQMVFQSALAGRPELSTYNDIRGINNPLTAVTLGGLRESSAFTRVGTILHGVFKPRFAGRIKDNDHGDISVYLPSGKAVVLDGMKYVEFPNSTAMSTLNPRTGEKREFILTRGVRPYKAGIRLSKKGANSPEGYISDVLLFEMVNGEAVYRHRVLDSAPEKTFFFEDPRISVINQNGRTRYLLSGTDYSPHIPDGKNPDVMNRYVELDVDSSGLPLRVVTDAKTKKPAFKNLSPEPSLNDGHWLFVDAKNATVAQNDLGQIVVRTRLRPDFGNAFVQKLADGQRWNYAEQVFLFRDLEHFESYDWNNALIDLFNKRSIVKTDSAVAPLESKTIIRETDLVEHLKTTDEKTQLTKNKAKGLGPGTRPLRVERRGSKLIVSDGPGALDVAVREIPANLISKIKIKDGETLFLTFDHEIRYYDQLVDGSTLVRRNYTASIKVFDRTLTNMIGYLPDVIQAKEKSERGLDSGILDLQHVYPMGFTIQSGSAEGASVRVFAGASDAHTTAYDFNIAKLLSENRSASRNGAR